MFKSTVGRRAFSLLELLVAVGILAVLVGLTLAAVQRMRAAAAVTVTHNNLRQIILGVHQLADQKPDGTVGGLPPAKTPQKFLYDEESIFTLILPYTAGPRVKPVGPDPDGLLLYNYRVPKVACYRDPADPTFDNYQDDIASQGRVSYAASMICFTRKVSYPFNIPDGTSTTTAFTTKYMYIYHAKHFYDNIFGISPGETPPYNRRATYADVGFEDVVPVRDAVSGMTVASQRGRTFQVMPPVINNVNLKSGFADDHVPQAFHPAGLSVAFFDGSVRTLRPGIDESTFWSLVTPNGNETITGDY